jgi:hypothetical protein
MAPPNPDAITMDRPRASGNRSGAIDIALHPAQSPFMKAAS